ncbi:MAG: class I SAM-dependent methyltransferase, partial [Anaerolineae bacterium]|nr:class I SAM-dependent methyltransferase [Anaerolineae bacterium]
MSSGESIKAQAQQRFSRFAQTYVASERHARGGELARLLELAQPQPDWLVLDVATGGGHTARTFAPHVRQMVAADISCTMLEAARGTIDAPNGGYVASDAENFAFSEACFDLVTCRIAPHHFPDVFRFVQECARVLKPGGLLLVQDLSVPEHDRAARYIDSFYRLRDPSHQRCYAEYEWRGLFLDAGLEVTHSEPIEISIMLVPWA